MQNTKKSRPLNLDRYTLAMNTKITFGEWLGDELDRRGWTQAELAEQLDMAESTVSGWMSGKPLRRRSCRRLARVLGLDENEVLVRAGRAPTDPNYMLPEEHLNEVREQRAVYQSEWETLDQRERNLIDDIIRLSKELDEVRARRRSRTQ